LESQPYSQRFLGGDFLLREQKKIRYSLLAKPFLFKKRREKKERDHQSHRLVSQFVSTFY